MTPKRFLLILVIIVILVAAGGGIYYMMSHDTFSGRSDTTTNTNEQQLTDDDVRELIKAVAKHMLLPQGEEPVAAQIVDVDELLKTQPFYRGAENGDMLLIYQATAKAILYSPRRDILVNVGPVVLDEEAPVQPGPLTDAPSSVEEEVQSPEDAEVDTMIEEETQ